MLGRQAWQLQNAREGDQQGVHHIILLQHERPQDVAWGCVKCGRAVPSKQLNSLKLGKCTERALKTLQKTRRTAWLSHVSEPSWRPDCAAPVPAVD
eukprot:5626557-Amphidinium_carterae.1